MYLYKQLVRLFSIDTAFKLLKLFASVAGKLPFGLGFAGYRYRPSHNLGVNLSDLHFKNPIGLGPGLDRNALMYNQLGEFGFSFVEIGPVSGNSQLATVLGRLVNRPEGRLISLCISSNHEYVFSMAYDFADMFDFQIPDDRIIDVLTRILDLRLSYDCYKPVMLRLTHEIPNDLMADVINFCRLDGVDAIVIGKTENVRKIHDYTLGRYPIIGYGDLRSPKAVSEMLDAGASLVQITTGLVLDGPSLVKKTLKYLDDSKC